MADFISITDFQKLIDGITEIVQAMPGNVPVVSGLLPLEPNQLKVTVNGSVPSNVAAFAVWSTGEVTPIVYTGHTFRTTNPEDSWHFTTA